MPTEMTVPPRARSRLAEVDALRGIALAGIAIVNVPYMALPAAVLSRRPDSTVDLVAAVAIELLLEGKVFLLFALMFGWGIGAQLEAARQAGRDPRPTVWRRLVGLLLIGAVHALLLYAGDVLMLYAVLGLLIWPMRDYPVQSLLTIGGLMLAATAGGLSLLWHGAGDTTLLFQAPLTLAGFAAGLAAHRARLLELDSPAWRVFRGNLGWLVAPAILGNVAHVASLNGWLSAEPAAAIAYASLAIGAPALASLYLAAIVALARRGSLDGIVTAAGRLSLSVYVGTSIIAVLIFGRHGLALFGKLGFAALTATAVAIWLLIAVLARHCLRVAGSGPLEALLSRVARGSWR